MTLYFVTESMVAQNGSVGIGTNAPHASAALDIQSTEKGILIPRMTSLQRTSISNAGTGLLVFDNTTGSFWFKTTSGWNELVDTATSLWKRTGVNDNIQYATGNVGIGATNPEYHLDINKPNASIGLTDSETGELSGFVQGNSKNLYVGASRVFLGNGDPGDLLLQTHSGFAVAGNVGIGKINPLQKLSVMGELGLYDGNDTVGIISSFQRRLTINSRLGRGSIQPEDLILQRARSPYNMAGNVGIGTDFPREKLDVSGNIITGFNIEANGNIIVGGEVQRPATGGTNMLPYAHGRVLSNGTITSGSGNFSVTRISEGVYEIFVSDVNPEFANMTITGAEYGDFMRTFNYDTQGNTFRVYCYQMSPVYVGSILISVGSERRDSAFSFVVIKY